MPAPVPGPARLERELRGLRPRRQNALATTEELDYREALDWFGLRFVVADGKETWRLEVRPDATEAERGRLKAWLEPGVPWR